jgi:heme-degrading monooxygenase HmoA
MYFLPNKQMEFLKIFNEVKSTIFSMHGCISVDVVVEDNDPNMAKTVSYWESEADLNVYRNTPFFKETWQSCKVLFCNKAIATSSIIE